MKKLAMGSLLAVSTSLAVVGVSQANAVDYNASSAADQLQQRDGKSHAKHHRGERRGGHMQGLLSQLNLSDAQQAQIKAIKDAERSQRQNERATLQAKREQQRAQMQSVLNATTLNTAALNSLANQHAAQAKDRFIARAKTQHAIAQVLTPAQRSQLEQLHDERAERRMARSNNR